MYTFYFKAPPKISKNWIRDLSPVVDDDVAMLLYSERIRFLEIFVTSMDLCCYLLVLSLRNTTKIDSRSHLSLGDSLMTYSREAMREMLVIRLRDLFDAKKNKPDEFHFHGFHKTLKDMKIHKYLLPTLEVNNSAASIIKRRNFYSSKHTTDEKGYSFKRERFKIDDLVRVMLYISKVESALHGNREYDVFERLLNDELEADRPLVWDYTYEILTGLGAYELNGDHVNTPEFDVYKNQATKELQKLRLKYQGEV